ncbi:AAA family ATPase [Acinetobacter pullicarnis]|uniref:AAA family ATPase n=1 Tax=Acinetobacter pullicarnis TaxID=2576829 RepID=UPI001E4A5D5A|nr:AAA family ATPase [Acinetobacter pullicarnis]
MSICGEIPHAGISTINIPLIARNLIITGKNGSGKTSFLNLLSDKIKIHLKKEAQIRVEAEKELEFWTNKQKNEPIGSREFANFQNQINYQSDRLKKINEGLHLEFVEEFKLINHYDNLEAIFVFFKAMRIASIQETKQTSSIEEEKIKALQSLKNNQDVNFGNKLEQHLVNIKVNQSLAITEDNNQVQADKFQEWFNSFDDHLKFLFEDDSAHLVFYRQNYKFKISLNNREFDFQTLSSGYLAIFEILADLLVRSEFFDITPDQLQGIVIIDEIDAHLHISLQKKILPFFIKLFPHLQFIVSTHSPFVITSTGDDTVVYDISSGEFFEDNLSQYSYESVVKGLFHVNPVSSEIRNSTEYLKNLLNANQIDFEEIRAIIKELKPLEISGVLDKKIQNLYLQAENLLLDNNELGG